jgi:hypothetical protein
MKLFFIGLMILAPVLSFASEICGQTWSNEGRFYIDGSSLTDIEVLIPAHATSQVTKHFKRALTAACLTGVLVEAGEKEVFIALDIE